MVACLILFLLLSFLSVSYSLFTIKFVHHDYSKVQIVLTLKTIHFLLQCTLSCTSLALFVHPHPLAVERVFVYTYVRARAHTDVCACMRAHTQYVHM